MANGMAASTPSKPPIEGFLDKLLTENSGRVIEANSNKPNKARIVIVNSIVAASFTPKTLIPVKIKYMKIEKLTIEILGKAKCKLVPMPMAMAGGVKR